MIIPFNLTFPRCKDKSIGRKKGMVYNKKTAACKAPEDIVRFVSGRKRLRTCPLAYVVLRSGSGSSTHKLTSAL